MKTVPTTTKQSNLDMKRAIILFPRPYPRNLERGQSLTYKLCATPADATSPIYKLSIPFFNKGTPEEWIKFRRGLAVVLKGQNVTQGPASYA
eukprot:681997-Ditylum_brightwellii.AAC.1